MTVAVHPAFRASNRDEMYSVEMMLAELDGLKIPNGGDTRNYLSLDMVDRAVLRLALTEFKDRRGA